MKILHIPNYYYPHIGGIEQTAHDIVNSLRDSNEQKVICFNSGKKTGTDEVDGIEVIRCGALIKVSSQALSLSYNKLLKKQFKNFEPEMVIFHFPNPFVAHFLLKRIKKHPNCKLIVWWHLDITRQKILGKLFKGQTKKLLNRADKIIATSPNYIKGSRFLKEFEQKCTVIPSCINENRLCITESTLRMAEEVRAQNKDKIICFAVGRHVEYKGYEYLIEASKNLDDNFKIFIGGTGKLTEKLKTLATSDKKIEFLGKLTDEEVKAYMYACDIYCFPSITKNEAFGLALAEAMFFGKPAVTFTIDGSRVNFVNLDKITGIEVENRNSDKYSEALKLLAENKDVRAKYGQAGYERVSELFTLAKFKENIIKLMADL